MCIDCQHFKWNSINEELPGPYNALSLFLDIFDYI